MITRSSMRLFLAAVTLAGLAPPVFAQKKAGAEAQTRGSQGMLEQELAFPTGDRATSVLALERRVPSEVRAGATFDYELRLVNISRRELQSVAMTEHFPPNFRLLSTDPRPASDDGESRTWRFTRLAPGATEVIKLRGTTERPETLNLCATVTLSDSGCTSVRVVQPDLTFTRSAPREVLLCDPIPLQYLVGNPGTGLVRNVRITETLPAGMTTTDGKTNIILDAGDLGPGQSRNFTVNAQATRAGEFRNAALARAEEDNTLTREASAAIIIRRPVLEVSIASPEFRFAGRPANIDVTVRNTGDAAARDTVLTDTLPPGVELISADAGQPADGRVTWKLGTLEPGAIKTVHLKLRGSALGLVRNQVNAKANCAEASAVAPLEIRGVPAILLEMRDDPDPIEIGGTTTYTIEVTNQGTMADTNIVVAAVVPDEQEYVSSEGATRGAVQGKTVQFMPLGSLAPKAKATWKIVVRGLKEADVRFKVTLNSDATGAVPVEKTESTHIY